MAPPLTWRFGWGRSRGRGLSAGQGQMSKVTGCLSGEVAVLPEQVAEHMGDAFPGGPACAACHFPESGVSLRQVRYRGGLPASCPAEATATLDRANRTSPPNCLPRGLTVKCVFSWPRGDARTLTCPRGLQAGLTGSDGGPRGPWDFYQPRERDVHHRLLHPGRTRVRACTGVCVCERTHGCTRCVRP